MALAHIRNGQIVARFVNENGWLMLESGIRVSPIVAGFASGDDLVVPVEEETVDVSTTGVTESATETIVEAARVLVRTTISDVAPSEAMVNAERDRRITAGATFTVSGYGDVPVTGRADDKIVLIARGSKAEKLKAVGVTDPVLLFRDAANVNHMFTPDQMIELVEAGTAWIEETMAVSWAMKDGTAPFEAGIPADFATNEAYWPNP